MDFNEKTIYKHMGGCLPLAVLIMNNPHHTAAFSKANILQIMDAVILLSETHNKSE